MVEKSNNTNENSIKSNPLYDQTIQKINSIIENIQNHGKKQEETQIKRVNSEENLALNQAFTTSQNLDPEQSEKKHKYHTTSSEFSY